MFHRASTPLALMLAAVLLGCISLIPARPHALAPAVAPVTNDATAALVLRSDPDGRVSVHVHGSGERLAVLLAVHAASWALDRAIAERAEGVAREPLMAEASPPDVSRRGIRAARPMTPFYSFASSATRAQES
jgi:hypothetical protein